MGAATSTENEVKGEWNTAPFVICREVKTSVAQPVKTLSLFPFSSVDQNNFLVWLKLAGNVEYLDEDDISSWVFERSKPFLPTPANLFDSLLSSVSKDSIMIADNNLLWSKDTKKFITWRYDEARDPIWALPVTKLFIEQFPLQNVQITNIDKYTTIPCDEDVYLAFIGTSPIFLSSEYNF